MPLVGAFTATEFCKQNQACREQTRLLTPPFGFIVNYEVLNEVEVAKGEPG